jgi:hypothetical protein
MSSGPISGAVLALLAAGLRSRLPSWRWTEPEPAVSGGVQVSGPVTDSILTTFDCNCHCQDNSVVVGLLAFLCGLSAALTLVCICRRFYRATEESFEATPAAPVTRRPLQQQPVLALENVPRRAVVTPSSRR